MKRPLVRVYLSVPGVFINGSFPVSKLKAVMEFFESCVAANAVPDYEI